MAHFSLFRSEFSLLKRIFTTKCFSALIVLDRSFAARKYPLNLIGDFIPLMIRIVVMESDIRVIVGPDTLFLRYPNGGVERSAKEALKDTRPEFG